jgi:hypothetical protein
MTKNRLPFGWAPAHWGLKGKLREVAKAEYELEGEALERRLLEINIGERTEKDIELEVLKLDHKYGKIDNIELEKQAATAKDEPWVTIKSFETDPDNPRFGGVELDWNDAFIKNLEKHGYGPHPVEDDIVNEWFNDVCRTIALEAFDGIGDFQEKMDEADYRLGRLHEDVITTEQLQESKDAKNRESKD